MLEHVIVSALADMTANSVMCTVQCMFRGNNWICNLVINCTKQFCSQQVAARAIKGHNLQAEQVFNGYYFLIPAATNIEECINQSSAQRSELSFIDVSVKFILNALPAFSGGSRKQMAKFIGKVNTASRLVL